jgi:hypothetical protein
VNNQNLDACEPQRYYGGDTSKTILPCGLIAWSFFNDTYQVRGRPAACWLQGWARLQPCCRQRPAPRWARCARAGPRPQRAPPAPTPPQASVVPKGQSASAPLVISPKGIALPSDVQSRCAALRRAAQQPRQPRCRSPEDARQHSRTRRAHQPPRAPAAT